MTSVERRDQFIEHSHHPAGSEPQFTLYGVFSRGTDADRALELLRQSGNASRLVSIAVLSTDFPKPSPDEIADTARAALGTSGTTEATQPRSQSVAPDPDEYQSRRLSRKRVRRLATLVLLLAFPVVAGALVCGTILPRHTGAGLMIAVCGFLPLALVLLIHRTESREDENESNRDKPEHSLLLVARCESVEKMGEMREILRSAGARSVAWTALELPHSPH